MIKVLVADKTSEEGLKILRDKNYQVDSKTGLPEDELIAIIPEYDAMIVRSATRVTAPIIENASKLKVVGRAGVGVDNIDIPAATKKGIIVMNAPSGNTISAAEHTVAMITAVSRNIPQAYMALKTKTWYKKQYMGSEIYGRTLGVIGFGKIGGHVAKVMSGFGMKVVIYDPFLSADAVKNTDFTIVDSLEELLKQADYVTPHIPKQKEYVIGAKEIAMMKAGAYLINVARGGVVDEAALYEALKSGKLKGAALDVFENEPKKEGTPFDTPLAELDNVIVTPHLGASTVDAQEKVAVDIANQFVDYFENNLIKNAVNIPTPDPNSGPFLPLAEQLGSFASQICEGNVNKVDINYYGPIANFDTKILKLATLKGMLSRYAESVNYVNASLMTEERNITVTESKSEKAENFVNLINVQIDGTQISGTLFDGNKARIVAINDFELDISPAHHHVMVEHDDVPGVVGKVGSIMGDNKINIEGMSVGKTGTAKSAMMVLSIDKALPANVAAEMTNVAEIRKVKSISL
ncbi:phosphoglycerate dehydrogenase [candidate division KSB1 bacterium]|nr:phosphoglycerate dehydrogenase [candidate division KSB1 bacterium]